LPICRSLILTDPQDKALYNDKAQFLDSEFMVRNDLLIAPSLNRNLRRTGTAAVTFISRRDITGTVIWTTPFLWPQQF